MRFAILSDIHANLEALEAVLEDARAFDCNRFVCLGDLVGYNANPRECLEIVRQMDCLTVQGNHDEQASQSQSTVEFNDVAERAIQWTRQQLTVEERAWLGHLQLQQQVRDFTIVHAALNPSRQWHYVASELDALGSFSYQHTALCFFGHTHVQEAFVRDRNVHRVQAHTIRVELTKKYLVNAGSVGQPRDGDWRAAYCIYHAAENLVEQRRVRYNVKSARQKVIAAGLPQALADRLLVGR